MSDEDIQMTRTGFAWDEWCMWHNTGIGGGLGMGGGFVEPYIFMENPEVKRRVKHLMDRSGMTERMIPVKPRSATEEELAYVHTQRYIDLVREKSEGEGGTVGFDTPVGRDSFEIAKRSTGALLSAIDMIVSGEIRNAYAFCRPPGHHALADEGLGMCIFANASIGARHAQRKHGLKRIAIIDYDTHHGNGTQDIFYSDPSVLSISVHQRNWFSVFKTSDIEFQGEGEGVGANMNIPLPSGSGDGALKAAFERVVIPALHRFKPDMIIVAASYDMGFFDPMGRMVVTSDGFRFAAEQLVKAADELCEGRIVMEHEGGYSPHATPFHALATVEALCGTTSGVEDPFTFYAQNEDQELLPHQEEAIDKARTAFGL